MGSATHWTVHQMEGMRAAVDTYGTGWTGRAELVGAKSEWVHFAQHNFHIFIILF
jgi:hypothetical protein